LVSGQAQVTPCLQQTEGDILGRAYAFGKGLAKEAALLHELGEQMGNLQEKVEDFASLRMLSVSVFQFESPVLLHIEAFVLDFPA
jgi:hypothetical protein